MATLADIQHQVTRTARQRQLRIDLILDDQLRAAVEEAQFALNMAEREQRSREANSDEQPQTRRYGATSTDPVGDATRRLEAAQTAAQTVTLSMWFGRVSPDRYSQLVKQHEVSKTETDIEALCKDLAAEGFTRAAYGGEPVDGATWDDVLGMLTGFLGFGDVDGIWSALLTHNREKRILVAEDFPTSPPPSGKPTPGTS